MKKERRNNCWFEFGITFPSKGNQKLDKKYRTYIKREIRDLIDFYVKANFEGGFQSPKVRLHGNSNGFIERINYEQ